MKRGERYPAVMYLRDVPPREVPAEQFVTQDEAARRLGVRSLLTVGRMIGEERLRPVTLNGEPGVELASVEEELHRRTRRFWRLRAAVKSVLHWFSF